MNEKTQITEAGSRKFALFGAAGTIGRSVADALRIRGIAYRVVGRDRERLSETFGHDPIAEIVTWNSDDPESVQAAAEGIDTIIYLVGVPYNHFELHPLIMQQTLDGAIAARTKRIVLIGTVYAYGLPTTPKVAESHPRNSETFKGKMRKQQEDILLQAHADGRIQAAILRLPDFYGPEVGDKSFLHLLFQAATNGGAADMIGPLDRPHEFVFVPDVGPVVIDLALKPESYGHWWNFAGAGVITQREIVDRVFAMAGKKPKLRVIGKTGLQLIGLFNPVMRELAEMNYLITSPVLLDDSALEKLLGPLNKTSYADGLRLTFEAYMKVSVK